MLQNCLREATEFKQKADSFFKSKKYEQAMKVYEIAYDVLQEHYVSNTDKINLERKLNIQGGAAELEKLMLQTSLG